MGFAIFGWAHLILTFGSFSGGGLSPPPLLYEILMDDLRIRMMGPVITGSPSGGAFAAFHQIGLTLATLLVAQIGGYSSVPRVPTWPTRPRPSEQHSISQSMARCPAVQPARGREEHSGSRKQPV
jgi:hypothetical protein